MNPGAEALYRLRFAVPVFMLLIAFSCFCEEDEKTAYEKLQQSFEKYIEYLASSPGKNYDLISGPENSGFVSDYIKASDSYINAFLNRADFHMVSKQALPADIVHMEWVRFDSRQEYVFLVRIDGVSIASLEGDSLNEIWDEKLPGISGVSCFDVEDDGQSEIIAVSDEYCYIIRRTKTGRIYSRALPNNRRFRKLFKARGDFLGVYFRQPDRTDISTGWHLARLSWMHPGFDVASDLLKLSGNVFSFSENDFLTSGKQENTVVRYEYTSSGEIEKMHEFDSGIGGVPVALLPVPGERRTCIYVSSEGISTVGGQSASQSGGYEIPFIKQAWLRTGNENDNSLLLIYLTLFNELCFFESRKERWPLFK